jgi:hypothetical protein
MGSSQIRDEGNKPDLFGPDGYRAMTENADTLFPAAVRPGFLRLLWLALAVAGAAITAAVLAISGRLG